MSALFLWFIVGAALFYVVTRISYRVDVARTELAKFVHTVAPDVFDDFVAKPHFLTLPSTLNIRYRYFDAWIESSRLNKVPGMRERKLQYQKFRNKQRNLVALMLTGWFLIFVWLTLYVA